MTLSFSTVINGKPNYFIDKIWLGLYRNNKFSLDEYRSYYWAHNDIFKKKWDSKIWAENPFPPKLHTIRRDENNRWRAGMDIHMVVKPKGRFSAGFQFAPVIKCVSVQEIVINHYAGFEIRGIMIGPFASVKIDGKILRYEAIKQLAINDGFDSFEAFCSYFNKDFTGKIIHWTDLKY